MNDYMRALHQRFFQEPDCTEIRRELETLRLTLRDKLDRQDRETLLKLTDLAIELRETGRVVGTIGFVWIDDEHNCAEIGYSLAQEYWGRGLMTEALRAMLEFAFVRLHLNRVEAMFDVRNRASGRVMEKCGFTYRFSRWEDVELMHERRKSHYYALTKSQWEAGRPE